MHIIHLSVRVEGCILGTDTKVGNKAELVKCVTQASYEVVAGSECILFVSPTSDVIHHFQSVIKTRN